MQRKWEKFVEEDPELDEERQAARSQAAELRERANALVHFAEAEPGGEVQREKLHEAVALYCQADACISRAANGRRLEPGDRELVLQCRLNAACLALKAGDGHVAGRLCEEALGLDAENPHAALFLAQSVASRVQPKLAEQWAERARRWARQRGEEGLLRQAVEFLRDLPKKAGQCPQEGQLQAATNQEAIRLVQQGVALLKQRQAPQARQALERAVLLLDEPDRGGPIELFTGRRMRATAFDALEALGEALAALGEWLKARRCGLRAAALLEQAPGAEAPFGEPELHRREGLLFLSLGHAAAAAEGDPLSDWRRAAAALRQHGGDPVAEGQAWLEVGLWSARQLAAAPGRAVDAEVFEEAVSALGAAADQLGRARGRPAASGAGAVAAEAKRMELARKEFKAQAALASLLSSAGELQAADRTLDASTYLLGLAPRQPPAGPAQDWAEPCGQWAMAATQAGRLEDAERALLTQQRLGLAAASVETQLEAARALAVLRRKRRDEPGVEAALAAIMELTPESTREAELRRVRGMLRRVAPSAADEASTMAAARAAAAPATVVGVGGLRQLPARSGKGAGVAQAALLAPVAPSGTIKQSTCASGTAPGGAAGEAAAGAVPARRHSGLPRAGAAALIMVLAALAVLGLLTSAGPAAGKAQSEAAPAATPASRTAAGAEL
mmetsp:Transcript_11393/g.35259  ORF Transcript_11393/g.35259 Transcript_11393/m.35259 type:complete len:675 (-) Transcript_11393:140-2164(-)